MKSSTKGVRIRLLRTFRKESWDMATAIFGKRIKELRTKKGMTLDDLAGATGSSKSYIWELENRIRRVRRPRSYRR